MITVKFGGEMSNQNVCIMLIDLTYAQLITAINSESLSAGYYYRITDYQRNGAGPVEPIICLALSNNIISNQVYSELYPNDYIEYDYTMNLCDDGITPRPGWITRRFGDGRNDIVVYPGQTIQDYIDKAPDNVIIYVKKGTYNEALVVRDGIHLHLEDGVVIHPLTNSKPLYGTNLTNFKLTGNGKFITDTEPGTTSGIFLTGKTSDFSNLYYDKGIDLNGGLVLFPSSNYANTDPHPYYESQDGMNFARATEYSVPYFLQSFYKDDSNLVLGYKSYNSIYKFYYSEDNGKTWIENSVGLPSASLNCGAYTSANQNVYIGTNNGLYVTRGGYTEPFESDGAFTVVSKLFTVGVDVIALADGKIYRGVESSGGSVTTWTLMDSGIEGDTISHLTVSTKLFVSDPPKNTVYIFNSTEHKVYRWVLEVSTVWEEIPFEISLTSLTCSSLVAISNAETYNDNNYEDVFLSISKYGVFRLQSANTNTTEQHWECVNKGISVTTAYSNVYIYKVGDNLFTYGYYLMKRFDGRQWIPIYGGPNIELEFDSIDQLGPNNTPNNGDPALYVVCANLKLNCNKVLSRRNCGILLWSLYGRFEGKVRSIETGTKGLPDTGSTGLITRCHGTYEGDEIIVNNVGHCISHRDNIMHFKVRRLISTANNDDYRVGIIAQISNQANTGTTSIFEVDEMIFNRGRYNGATGLGSDMGYIIYKGRKIEVDGECPVSVGGCDLFLEVDIAENKYNWCAVQMNTYYPNKVYIKNTALKSRQGNVLMMRSDWAEGEVFWNTQYLTLENCDLEAWDKTNRLTGFTPVIMGCNYALSGFTQLPATINLKGLNTFDAKPISTIHFTGNGTYAVNGVVDKAEPLFYMMFEGDQDKYYIAPNERLIKEMLEFGQGTVVIYLSEDEGATFTQPTLPFTIKAGDLLKLSCSGTSVTGKTITLI